MENNNFERNSNSTNTAPTGWESLEQEGRRHDLAEKVKAKFSGETFKRAAQVAMLGIMTAVMLTAAKTDKTAAEKAPVATESVDKNYGKNDDTHAGNENYMDVTPTSTEADTGINPPDMSPSTDADAAQMLRRVQNNTPVPQELRSTPTPPPHIPPLPPEKLSEEPPMEKFHYRTGSPTNKNTSPHTYEEAVQRLNQDSSKLESNENANTKPSEITPPDDISYIKGDAINNPDTQQWSHNDTDPRFDESAMSTDINNADHADQPQRNKIQKRDPFAPDF